MPNHIAIIMDGNGRWAQKKFLPRVAGHREGMNTVKKITKHASKLGVKVLTLYAFSTENWKRPNDEVNFLMQLPVDFFDTFVPDLIEENVQVNVMGFIDELPPHTKKAVENAIRDTKDNTGMILNFALNYGSRSELLEATKKMAKKVQQNELTLEEIDEETFEKELMTASLGEFQEPDLLVRTSGEERISNFLLWQIAYSEFYFTRILWPDFSEEVLENAIGIYQKRNRRFGGL
ncbi:isoprenyl transferase [Carnobacterium divergens]|uniref:Isoprenyl transferase n=1 Tax=Carnobacterium divergens TaxID=2748 RepID=A0AAW8R7Y9_CARDV|nr:isoprenyl transferase [Carnobacterium divergens]MDO0873661.1 isoprenyl transferase [Carnobacterium divergens]MDT1957923.1 isoprenyl transferase [Carnobacterium divergens]MDT1973926.1 isoprenyl transferase [Carnobacterium divergens]MDT1995230.1 isoprenyl transferase [Carnobacterium divergens]